MKTSRLPLPAILAALLVAGCDLLGGGDDGPVIAKPGTLAPEAQAFSQVTSRTYTWTESLQRPSKKDSILLQTRIQAVRSGDTTVAGEAAVKLALTPLFGNTGLTTYTANAPAPAAVVTRLGFRPSRAVTNSQAVPDPGADLPFPAAPAIGWRLDTTVGHLRFVRVLERGQTIRQDGARHECWAFAESTYVAANAGLPATLLGSGTTWMGATGLVRHRSVWTAFDPSTGGAGTLYREISIP